MKVIFKSRGLRKDSKGLVKGYYRKVWQRDALGGSRTRCYIYEFETKKEHEVIESSIGTATGIRSEDFEMVYSNDVVVDKAGRQFVVEYSEKKAAFVFAWTKDKRQKKVYSDFNSKQKPFSILTKID